LEQSFTARVPLLTATRSQPEMVGDMSRVTLNFDLSEYELTVIQSYANVNV